MYRIWTKSWCVTSYAPNSSYFVTFLLLLYWEQMLHPTVIYPPFVLPTNGGMPPVLGLPGVNGPFPCLFDAILGTKHSIDRQKRRSALSALVPWRERQPKRRGTPRGRKRVPAQKSGSCAPCKWTGLGLHPTGGDTEWWTSSSSSRVKKFREELVHVRACLAAASALPEQAPDGGGRGPRHLHWFRPSFVFFLSPNSFVSLSYCTPTAYSTCFEVRPSHSRRSHVTTIT